MMAGTRLTGVAASEGVAVGSAFVYVTRELEPERENIPKDAVDRRVSGGPKRGRYLRKKETTLTPTTIVCKSPRAN